MIAYVYNNEDEKFEKVIDEIEGESNEEINSKFEAKWGSNDFNYSFCDPK